VCSYETRAKDGGIIYLSDIYVGRGKAQKVKMVFDMVKETVIWVIACRDL